MVSKNKFLVYLLVAVSLLLLLFMVKGEINDSSKYELIESESNGFSQVTQENFDTTSTLEIENSDLIEKDVEESGVHLNDLIIEESNTLEKSSDSFIEPDFFVFAENQSQNDSLENSTIEENSTLIAYDSISLIVVDQPSALNNKSNVGFIFEINSSSTFMCNFSVSNGSYYFENLFNSVQKEINLSLQNSNYAWKIICLNTANYSINDSKTGGFNVNVDYSPKIEFYSNKYEIYNGQTIEVAVSVLLSKATPLTISVNYSDGRAPSSINVANTYFYNNTNLFSPRFDNIGNYKIGLTVNSNGSNYYSNFLVNVLANETYNNSNNNANNAANTAFDNEKPQIVLIQPEDKTELNLSNIIFSYNVTDNVKVSNCTFSLYYYNNSVSIGTLVYSKLTSNPSNGITISEELTDFDEGDYSWDIECFDNSSNKKEVGRDFSYTNGNAAGVLNIQTLSTSASNYQTDINEIDSILTKINEFLINEEKYNGENREVVEQLGILDETRYYKKRLLQMKSDLEDDLGYNKDIEAKNNRLDLIRLEIEDIRSKGVYGVNVEKSERFVKSSFDSDFDEIINSYLEKENIFMSKKDKSNLIESLKDIQNNVKIESYIKWVEIEYLNEKKKEFSLVYKDIEIEEDVEGLIEVIPKDVAKDVKDIEVSIDYQTINEDPIIFFNSEDISDSFFYKVEGYKDFSDLKKIDTIAFSLTVQNSKSNSVTGYSIIFFPSEKGFWFYFSWVFFIVLFAYILYRFIISRKVKALRENKGFLQIEELMNSAREKIEEKNVDGAKGIYLKIKEVYSASDSEVKQYYYNDLIKLQMEIDRKDISLLIKDCVSAINEKRNSDAGLLYSRIKPIYKRLPSDLKEKVYKKIIPFVIVN